MMEHSVSLNASLALSSASVSLSVMRRSRTCRG